MAYRRKLVLLDCEYCQGAVNAEVVASYEHAGEDCLSRFIFAKCPGCGTPFVALQENWGSWSEEQHFEDPVKYLPRPKTVSRDVPKDIAASFTEATDCFTRARAHSATAIMCRKTLQGICVAHSIDRPNLAHALRQLQDDGHIETRLYDWANELRLSGNEAAHNVAAKLSREDAQDILDFTNALLEYVFTFRDKFDAFKKRRAGSDAVAT